MDEAGARAYTLYRAVATNPATERDFLSYAALGRRLREPYTEVEREAFHGLSCWSRLRSAENTARKLGTVWVVEIRVTDPPVRVVRLVGNALHFTVFADATMLRTAIVRYHRVDAERSAGDGGI